MDKHGNLPIALGYILKSYYCETSLAINLYVNLHCMYYVKFACSVTNKFSPGVLQMLHNMVSFDCVWVYVV